MPGTNTEPVAVIGGISLAGLTALALAIMGGLEAFDVYDVTDSQVAAVVAILGAVWAVFVPALISIRGIVSSPQTVADTKVELATAPPVDTATAQALAK